jgi:hypothetical protein
MSGDPGAGRRGQRAAADDQQGADPVHAVRGAGEAAPDAAAGGALRDRPRYKLAPDYHVSIEGVAYSVPYRLIGRHVDVFSTVSLVSIFHKGSRPMPARRPNRGGRR